MVQLATRAGAMDFVVKDDSGIKWIPRALHTAVNEWTKRTKQSDKTTIIDDPNVKKLLKYMMKLTASRKQHYNTVPLVIQQIISKIAFDLEAEGKETFNDSAKIVNSLVKSGILKEQQIELIPTCPKCKSGKITPHYYCQNCNNSNFVRSDILEHNKCGYTDLETSFLRRKSKEDDYRDNNNKYIHSNTNHDNIGDELVCPKCRKELKLIGVDYFRSEGAYKCKVCDNIFTTVEQKFSCTECKHSNFKIYEAGWMPLYGYDIDSNKIVELKKKLVSLDPLKEFLIKYGFEDVREDYKFETKYGIFGPFDLVAIIKSKDKTDGRDSDTLDKNNDIKNYLIVIVLGSDMEENFAKLVELDTLNKSISNSGIFKYAVMFSELGEVTRNLLQKFEVTYVLAENEDLILQRFKEKFVHDIRINKSGKF
jgi:hypothetical protein